MPKATVVHARPTKTQRAWWSYLAIIGVLSAAGAIGIIYEQGPERGFWLAIIFPGLLISIAGFASGTVLRQRRTAERTILIVSEDGTLRIIEPGSEVSRSLVGARGLSIRHGTTVAEMYGAELPATLASSGPYGAVVIDTASGRDVLVFAGELPRREQELLLNAARPFLAADATIDRATPTPDEVQTASPLRRKLRDFGKMMGTILLLLLPSSALLVVGLALRGDLDRNTLWFSIPLCVGGAVVVIVGAVRRWRR